MLLAFAREGRFPSRISATVESKAVTHGWAPDGSQKKWEAAVHLVPVTDVSFDMSLLDGTPEPAPGDAEEVSRTPVGLDLVPELRKIVDRQGWLLVALTGLAAIMLFKH